MAWSSRDPSQARWPVAFASSATRCAAGATASPPTTTPSTARIAKNDDERERQLQPAAARIDVAVRGLRDLITDLRPAALDELGLSAALEALTERVGRGGELSIDLHVDLAYEEGGEPGRLFAAIEDAIYRIVQEALTNIVKHAAATHADVIVRERGELVEAVIGDNGTGFDPEGEFAGFGLLGMRERVTLVDGTITIASTPGEGTTVRASLPVRRADARAIGA